MTVRADYRQFVAEDAGIIAVLALMTGAVPAVIGNYDRWIAVAAVSLLSFLVIVLGLRYVMLVTVKWYVGEETLCRARGILSKQTDYIELYRITDYKESQSFLQRLMGVKTVTVYSTDQSDTVSTIQGVSAETDLIGMLREKVEKCKHEKRIYEITNH